MVVLPGAERLGVDGVFFYCAKWFVVPDQFSRNKSARESAFIVCVRYCHTSAYEKGSTNLVRVPIPLISKPATDAAAEATRAASAATSAAEQATQAKEEAEQAKTETEAATTAANDATARVNQAMDNINEIKTTANNADTLSKALSEQLKNYNIETPTTQEFEDLETKDDNTLYFCTENESETP